MSQLQNYYYMTTISLKDHPLQSVISPSAVEQWHCQSVVMRLLMKMTDDSSMLEELYMWSTKLSSRAAIELFTALYEAKKLKILEITKNDVTDEACDSIIMAMKMNTSLVELCICSNPIDVE